MIYINQFKEFDPLVGKVPNYPFALTDIAERSRRLLGGLTEMRMLSAAKRISEEVEEYFARAKELKIYGLHTDLYHDRQAYETYFEWDEGAEGREAYFGFDGLTGATKHWRFKEWMTEELDIPTEENTSEVEAFKSVIEKRDCDFFLPAGAPEPEPKEYPEGRDYELFAVLSLCLLADAIECLSCGESRIWSASRYSLRAMDAVCYAEHLKEIDGLVSHMKKLGERRLSEALVRQRAEHRKREIQYGSVRGKTAVSHRMDQKLKPIWEAHCKNAVEQGITISTLNELFAIEGCDLNCKKYIDARTLKRWAKEAAGIEFKPGRPKKNHGAS